MIEICKRKLKEIHKENFTSLKRLLNCQLTIGIIKIWCFLKKMSYDRSKLLRPLVQFKKARLSIATKKQKRKKG